MQPAAIQSRSPLQRIEVLEYGKYCSDLDGPIEYLEEYRILGQTPGFPPELALLCSPSHYSLARDTVEMERLGLPGSRGWGTVIWPIRAANVLYHVCYRVGRRAEGGGRDYMVARYLCSREPINPWFYYRAMTRLRGLTREKAAEVVPIDILATESLGNQEFAADLVERALSGLELPRPVHALIDDEECFFRLCGSVWTHLDRRQRGLFSCGWNVGASIGRCLLISFGPDLAENAARLDPAKPARAVRSTRDAGKMFRSAAKVLEACRGLSRSRESPPNTALGFDDPYFVAEFCEGDFERDLIHWMPELLEQPEITEADDPDRTALIECLLRFDLAEQRTLYDTIESALLQRPVALRSFSRLDGDCRKRSEDWARRKLPFTLELAARLLDAESRGATSDFLAGLDDKEMAGSDKLAALTEVLSKSLTRRSEGSAAILHRRLLSSGPPQWYRRWLPGNSSDVAVLLLEAGDAESLGRLGRISEDFPGVGVATAIASREAPGPDAAATLGRLEASWRAKLARCLYRLWFKPNGNWFEGWRTCLRDDLPPSLLKFSLTGWPTAEAIPAGSRSEFEMAEPRDRLRLVRFLRELCDADCDRAPLFDRIWSGYFQVDPLAVVRGTADWNSTAAIRLHLRVAAANGQARETSGLLIKAAAEGAIDALGEADAAAILEAIDRLAGDADDVESLDRLIRRCPDWPPLRSWLSSELASLRLGAWLLSRENVALDVLGKFSSLCAPAVRDLLEAIRSRGAIPESIRSLRDANPPPEVMEWLASYVERQWGRADDDAAQAVAAWARWTGSERFQDPALRLFAGLPFDPEAFRRSRQWIALAQATNAHIRKYPDLTLMRALFSGSFEGRPKPSDADWEKVASILRADPELPRERGCWLDLWNSAREAWQKLMVLAFAPWLVVDLPIDELATLRQEPALLQRAVSARHGFAVPKLAGPSGQLDAQLLRRLEIANSDFQTLRLDDPYWSESAQALDTPLKGAFQRVPRRFYDDEKFGEVLRAYFPGWERQDYSDALVKGLHLFVRAYDPADQNYSHALALIERVFLSRRVWGDKAVRNAIEADLRRGHAARSIFAGKLLSRAIPVEWVRLRSGYVDTAGNVLRVNTDLKELLDRVDRDLRQERRKQ